MRSLDLEETTPNDENRNVDGKKKEKVKASLQEREMKEE